MRQLMRNCLIGFLLAAFVFFLPLDLAALADISGKPKIIDGDTIEIAGQRIRLHGIDTPEVGQLCEADGKPWHCGQEATLALTKAIGRNLVGCFERDRDRYGRVVAICKIGGSSGLDLAKQMVSEGWALAYRYYSMEYVAQEEAAKAVGKGLWRGEFVRPWDWRRGKRLAIEAVNNDRPCPIKGNIGRSDVRIYHVPGGAHYRRTKIHQNKGERWFCSEEEARRAGWRRSKR